MAGTTTNYSLPYPEPTDLVADYPALGQDLAEELDTILTTVGGLSLVAASSFSAVASVSINNCFTTTYDSYKVLVKVTGSSQQSLFARLRVSGADATAANYNGALIFANTSTGPSKSTPTSQTFMDIGYAGTSIGWQTGDIYGPALTAPTAAVWTVGGWGTNYSVGIFHGTHTLSTAYDGLTIYPASGTITGAIRVFGYQNS